MIKKTKLGHRFITEISHATPSSLINAVLVYVFSSSKKHKIEEYVILVANYDEECFVNKWIDDFFKVYHFFPERPRVYTLYTFLKDLKDHYNLLSKSLLVIYNTELVLKYIKDMEDTKRNMVSSYIEEHLDIFAYLR